MSESLKLHDLGDASLAEHLPTIQFRDGEAMKLKVEG